MKKIADIRLYKSDVDNVDGNPIPRDIEDKALAIGIDRVVMKLRENGAVLYGFDHLYLNFTVCLPVGTIQPAARRVDTYHPRYRYVDIGVERELFDSLGVVSCLERLAPLILQALRLTVQCEADVGELMAEALQQGAQMRVKFKEKATKTRVAALYLRLLDDGYYLPLLTVRDREGRELLCVDLPRTLHLHQFGEIRLCQNYVTLMPRKNVFATQLSLQPLRFEW